MSVFTPESGCSAERESVGLNARIEKFDFERAVGDRAVLPDELIQTLLVDDTLAVGVSVGAVIRIRRGVAGCCAGTASGHAAADPATTLMKSRRRIAFTKAGTTPNRTQLQQGFATGEMVFNDQFALQKC
jgi:hypothetical protein